jgi:hypothetical protein
MSRSTTTSGAAPQTGKTAQTATQNSMPAAPAGSMLPMEKVAARAYQKWMQKGCKHGSDTQDWLEAEAEIKAEMARTGKK